VRSVVTAFVFGAALFACSLTTSLDGFSSGGADAGSDAPVDTSVPPGSEGGADAGPDAPPAIHAQYKRTLTIANAGAAAVPSGYAACFTSAGVLGQDLGAHVRSDLADVAVVGPSGVLPVVAETVVAGRSNVCFRLARPIAPGASDDGYTLYYGDPSATPVDRASDVYPFHDGFDAPLDKTRWSINGTARTDSGNLLLEKNAENAVVTAPATDGIPLEASIELRVRVVDPSSAGGTSSGYFYWFGFQRSGDFVADAPYAVFISWSAGKIQGDAEFNGACEPTCSGPTRAQTSDFHVYRIDRAGPNVTFRWDDGSATAAANPGEDEALIVRNFMATSDLLVDWVRARPIVFPEPTAALGPEQTTP
jgi:hypothetical protein